MQICDSRRFLILACVVNSVEWVVRNQLFLGYWGFLQFSGNGWGGSTVIMFWPGHCIIERRPIAQPSVIPYSKTNIFWHYIWLYSCQNAIKKRSRDGPFTRYVELRVAHAPGMPGTFSPPLTSKETASWRSQYASRHVHDARAVMHFVIAGGEYVLGIPVACPAAILRIRQEARVHIAIVNRCITR